MSDSEPICLRTTTERYHIDGSDQRTPEEKIGRMLDQIVIDLRHALREEAKNYPGATLGIQAAAYLTITPTP